MEVISAVISILCTLACAAVAIMTFLKSTHESKDNEGKESGMVLTEIGYIKSGVDDIKRHQEKQDDQYLELRQRVTKAEASVSQAHKRLDKLERGEHQ